jgi:hypothetical protein
MASPVPWRRATPTAAPAPAHSTVPAGQLVLLLGGHVALAVLGRGLLDVLAIDPPSSCRLHVEPHHDVGAVDQLGQVALGDVAEGLALLGCVDALQAYDSLVLLD